MFLVAKHRLAALPIVAKPNVDCTSYFFLILPTHLQFHFLLFSLLYQFTHKRTESKFSIEPQTFRYK